MMPSSVADLISFGQPLWPSFDDNLEYDADTENHLNRHQSLPDQIYNNLTDRKASRKTKYMKKADQSKQGPKSAAR